MSLKSTLDKIFTFGKGGNSSITDQLEAGNQQNVIQYFQNKQSEDAADRTKAENSQLITYGLIGLGLFILILVIIFMIKRKVI